MFVCLFVFSPQMICNTIMGLFVHPCHPLLPHKLGAGPLGCCVVPTLLLGSSQLPSPPWLELGAASPSFAAAAFRAAIPSTRTWLGSQILPFPETAREPIAV